MKIHVCAVMGILHESLFKRQTIATVLESLWQNKDCSFCWVSKMLVLHGIHGASILYLVSSPRSAVLHYCLVCCFDSSHGAFVCCFNSGDGSSSAPLVVLCQVTCKLSPAFRICVLFRILIDVLES